MLAAPDILIVTPTLGTSPFLPELMSGLAKTGISVRHVLVAPAAAVPELRQRWPEAEVLAEIPGGGIYGAINQAANARDLWKWVTWINDDDRILPGWLGLESRALAGPAVDVLYSDVEYLKEDGTPLALLPVAHRGGLVAPLLASGVAPFSQQGALIGRGLWTRLGGIDASFRIAGDFDFWVRAAASGAHFEYVPVRAAGFRLRPGQASGDAVAALREQQAVLQRTPIAGGTFARWSALAQFRLGNLPRLLRRAQRTGRWRSAELYSR